MRRKDPNNWLFPSKRELPRQVADIVDKATRSRMMSGIRSTNTQPELRVRRYLHQHGLRFRLHVRDLPGRPDIVLPKYRTVVQVHGCFWHQHPGCRFAARPKSHRTFWMKKLLSNRRRDGRVTAELQSEGWRVFVVWECQTTRSSLLRALVPKIRRNRLR